VAVRGAVRGAGNSRLRWRVGAGGGQGSFGGESFEEGECGEAGAGRHWLETSDGAWADGDGGRDHAVKVDERGCGRGGTGR
jgi:hypothetical protein